MRDEDLDRRCHHRLTIMTTDTARYQIVVQGELDERFARLFNGMSVRCASGRSEIEGELVDQAALQGMLDRVADLGLVLLSVNRIGDDPVGRAD